MSDDTELKPGEYVSFVCPFCKKNVTAGNLNTTGVFELQVLHETPACEKFLALEIPDYMAAVNDATLDPEKLRKFRNEFLT